MKAGTGRSRMWALGLLLLIAAGALVLRVVRLDERPMHTDEAIHAVKLGELLDAGIYVYNPEEFHGPTLYYFALPLLWMSGVDRYVDMENSVPLRLVPALFGVGLVLLPLLFLDGFGRRAVLFSAILAAVSPAFVFYSRYYIQEILLVFFTWGAMGACWRYVRKPRIGWALLAGAFAGLAQASKETAAIIWVCGLAAAGLSVVVAHGLERQHREPRISRPRLWHVILAVLAACFFASLTLSAGFKNPRAIVDAVTAYGNYFSRASTGTGHGVGVGAHMHPWHYYLKMLVWNRTGRGFIWSEAFTVALALIGILPAIRPTLLPRVNRHLVRFLTMLVILLALIFSAIPYKTPWNMLVFSYGLHLLAGVGAAVLLKVVRFKAAQLAVGVVFLGGAYHLATQAWKGAFRYPSDPRTPYVYGHTSTNLLRLVERIESLSAVALEGRRIPITIIATADDYWPLPWYLRRYPNVGYWNEVPENVEAPILVVGEGMNERLEKRLGSGYLQEYYGLRPDVLMAVHIRQPLWDRFLRAQGSRD